MIKVLFVIGALLTLVGVLGGIAAFAAPQLLKIIPGGVVTVIICAVAGLALIGLGAFLVKKEKERGQIKKDNAVFERRDNITAEIEAKAAINRRYNNCLDKARQKFFLASGRQRAIKACKKEYDSSMNLYA